MSNCQYDAREIWELHEALVEASMDFRTYLRIVDLVKDAIALPLKEVARYGEVDVAVILRALPILREFDEIYQSQHDDKMWLVSASEEEVRLCRRRKLSLYNWVRLRPLMIELREDIMRYYQRALFGNWEEPIEKMGELKERWTRRLAPIVYPAVLSSKLSNGGSMIFTTTYLTSLDQRILKFAANGPFMASELSEELGLDRTVTSYSLRKLVSKGHLVRAKEVRPRNREGRPLPRGRSSIPFVYRLVTFDLQAIRCYEKELSFIKMNTIRFIRTCQDLVLNDICIPREYAEQVMRGKKVPEIEMFDLCEFEEEDEENGKSNGS